MENIWSDENYAGMQGRLLELMIKFQLCYKIPQNKYTFIAPQLLSMKTAEYNWDNTNNLILRYKYPDFMPKGIITRFIVVMHKWIDGQCPKWIDGQCPDWTGGECKVLKKQYVWRHGVVLKKDDTRAEIIENYGKREITVRVNGNSKRDWMTTVTYELDKINDSFNGLNYQKLIPCNCDTCINSQNPYSYDYQQLLKRLNSKKYTIECNEEPFHEVEISSLIDHSFTNKYINEEKLRPQEKKVYITHMNFGRKNKKINVQIGDGGEIKTDTSQDKQVGDKNKISSKKEFNWTVILGVISIFVTMLTIFFSGILNKHIERILEKWENSIFSKPTPELQQDEK